MAELVDRTVEIGVGAFALPNPRTPMLGRDAELASLVERLRDPAVPLITITGPGGVGKTRLALQAARDLRDTYDGDAVFVSLADVTGLQWFVRRIAQAMRLPGLETGFSESALLDVLADRRLLLVLDNLEQIPEASEIIARIVDAAPQVKLLVTSRVAMHLRGEVEFPLAPLALPDASAHRTPTFEELAANSAVALFVDRARAVDPSFGLTRENAGDIGRICARLDGLPLAIELSAARLKLLSPAALLSRLDNRLRILGGGARDLPDRQQNLRQTIAWSYDLLDAPERSAFRALAVFAGGFTFEAAAALLGVEADDPDLFDTLGSLIDQSLLRRTNQPDGEPRLAMLETIREFGLEQLRASGEEEALRSAHAAFYQRLVERVSEGTFGVANAAISDELEDELPNIHQALDWYIDREEADGAVSIVLAMSQFWMKRGYLVEGSRLMERAVEFVDRIEPVTQVRMLRSSAWFICVGGEYDEALVRVKRAVEMARALDRPEELAWTINGLGVIHYYREEIDEARAALEESLTIAEPGTRYRLGALNNLGVIARQQGNLDAARDYFQQCIDEERTYSLHDPEAHSLLNLVDVQLRLGERTAAQERLNAWFSERRRMRSLELAAVGLWVAARIAADEGDAERAAQMLGWADDQLKRLSLSDPHADEPDLDMRDRLADALGAEKFDHLLAMGRELTIEQVIDMAVRVPGARMASPRHTSTRPAPAGLDPLTAREIEVARLVAAGKSTREIAETLFISARTTQTHVTNILGKLDLESRAALAAWVVRNDPDAI